MIKLFTLVGGFHSRSKGVVLWNVTFKPLKASALVELPGMYATLWDTVDRKYSRWHSASTDRLWRERRSGRPGMEACNMA